MIAIFVIIADYDEHAADMRVYAAARRKALRARRAHMRVVTRRAHAARVAMPILML